MQILLKITIIVKKRIIKKNEFYKILIMGKTSNGSGSNPNWPSTTGRPSGGGRGNAPAGGKRK